MKQLAYKIEDLDGDQSFGFDDLSFDVYKQQLVDTINKKKKELENLPNGIFSGCVSSHSEKIKPGIIALLGLKPYKEGKYSEHFLIYINEKGEVINTNKKAVLEILNLLKNEPRNINPAIDNGDSAELLKWQNHLLKWMKGLVVTEEMQEDGSMKQKMGEAAIDILNNLKSGSKLAFETLKTESSVSEKYAKENFDLITWFIVS